MLGELTNSLLGAKYAFKRKSSRRESEARAGAKKVLRVLLRTVRHYWKDWEEIFAGVSDPRKPEWITYPLTSLLFTGTLMFITQLSARRGIADYLRANEVVGEKMAAWFGVAETPHGDTLNYTYRRLQVAEVQEVVCRSVERLIRARALERYRLLGLYYTVAVDGTGVGTFREQHCKHCLTKTLRNGETLYYHPVLEAKLVLANGFAFSLMTEFIENATPTESKQDCELKAFYRLAKRLKARFPRLFLCLLLDGLFAGGPTFEICEKYHWKYLIVLPEKDLPNVHRSFAAVMPHLPKQHKPVDWGDDQNPVKQDYRWAAIPNLNQFEWVTPTFLAQTSLDIARFFRFWLSKPDLLKFLRLSIFRFGIAVSLGRSIDIYG